jgi:hypothetical protein
MPGNILEIVNEIGEFNRLCAPRGLGEVFSVDRFSRLAIPVGTETYSNPLSIPCYTVIPIS